jgi:hypothetical protein
MEPLKPHIKQELLKKHPEELAEYERLLSERFRVDPRKLTTPGPEHEKSARRKERIKELHGILFPPSSET